MQAEIAYILKGYPRLSETFISNEIYLLETMGLKLGIFSIKQSGESQVHGVIDKIQAPVYFLAPLTSLSKTPLLLWLWHNLPAYWINHIRLLKKRPIAYLRTLGNALWMSIRYRKGLIGGWRKVFIKEFLQAGNVAIQVIESDSVQHLHAHFCHGATTVAWFASTLSGKPYSFTAHAKDIYQQGQNPGDLLQKKIRHARFVTTCTGANLLYIQCALGQWLDKSCVHKVYHGLDIDRFQPVPNPSIRGSKPLQLLSVGRYVEKKGFHFLLEACAQLRQQGYQFHCRIIGEYGDQYQFLQKLQEQLGLQDCVSLDGSVTHEALPAIYQQSDIFVLPCQVLDNGDRDGIPNVLMEAMACGLAVVSSRISGIPELIESGEHGLLVNEQDSQALTETLQLLFAAPDLIVQLGELARARICQEFDARQTNQQLKQLFEHCINHSDHSEAYPCLKQI